MKKIILGASFIVFVVFVIALLHRHQHNEKKSSLPILGEYEVSFFTKDTLHYTVPGVALTDDKGFESEDILQGDSKIKILNFFFSSCPAICPAMNKNLKHLSEVFNDYSVVFQSISIDPTNDTAAKLSDYRTQNNFMRSNWIFYTGDKAAIFKMARNCKLMAFEDDNQENALVHDPTLVLLDNKNQIRGYYNSLQQADISKLEHDIFILIHENF